LCRKSLIATLAGLLVLRNPPLAAQNASVVNDDAYTIRIRQYTTQPYFLTELVDHLPASSKVPTPLAALGYIIGDPQHLTYSRDIYAYYRALAKASPRVRVFTAPERSEEGKEQLLVVVGDEANLAKLDRYKQITARLADPRTLHEDEAQALIAEGKTFYWASGSIHSTETGSPEMLMELAYRLAVEETPAIQAIRKNVIVLITPVLEVDGHDRVVDTINYHRANPGKPLPPLVYWGKYVAHDNNRDNLGMGLALSRNQMATFLEYHPQVLHDLHESVPFMYISTGTGPYNAWLDPITIDEWHQMAYNEVGELTRRGVPGIWTHGFYDGWAPNYMFYVANGHNAIGRFYETMGHMVPDTLEETVGADSLRAWFRPNPPLPRVKWSLRNNINLQQSGLLLALRYAADNKDRLLYEFYLKGKRAVAKPDVEGPDAYVIPADTPRPNEAADMVNLLRRNGIEVQRADAEFKVKETRYPAGSYIVRMDQPYSRMADMLLDIQYYNVNDPQPYDDTGWTLGALRNVRTVRVTDKAVLSVPMTLLTADVRLPGKVTDAPAIAAYIINHTAESALIALRYRLRGVKVFAAEAPFSIKGRDYNAGALIVPIQDNPGDLRRRLETATGEFGLTATAVDALPGVKTHEVGVPRIALVHTWTDTQNEGWYRMELDRLRIPYVYISTHVLRDTPNLRARYDVILFPPAFESPQGIVQGMPMNGDPIPWKKSALMPNVGLAPDQTDDVRGGLELRGLANLQRFVQEGGLFLACVGVARLPVDFGLISGVSIEEARQLKAQGSIYNATFADRKSPVSYGYEENLAVYFSRGPLLTVDKLPQLDEPYSGPRASGRGGAADADIVQAMPQAAPAPPKPALKPGEDPPITEVQRLFLGPYLTPPALRPRVILRFAAEEKDLLVSGMLAGGGELAGRPAVVDVPSGRGHVLLYANNPMWRHQTQGSFCLLLNAILNYDHLDAGIIR
jgi:hypothetical protein